MNKVIWTIIIILVLGIGGLIWLTESRRINNHEKSVSTTNPADLFKETDQSQKDEGGNDQPEEKKSIYFPVTGYSDRISVRGFGKNVKIDDHQALECGQPYSGFHTADDLEVSPQELGEEVPVFSIARGEVKQARTADGYGGLLVIDHTINGSSIIGIYGHLDQSSFTKKQGEEVESGERVAYLGDHCTAESGNERKHLHFGLYLSSDIDLRGYVDNQEELGQWINPKITLEDLKAAEPD